MRYKPLNSSKDEIRLLRRLPSRDNVLHFSLENFSLRTAPPFWAFSYVWGNPQKTSRIVVNNHSFEATANLVNALTTHVNDILTLRAEINHPHFQTEYLWADAICINQRNTQERSEQVLRMHKIYRQRIVCIYLNSDNRHAHQSVYDVLSLASKVPEGESFPQVPDSIWPDLVEFFSKDWFHRTWMIQEFILADTSPLMLFLGGHKCFKESQLRDAAWKVFQHHPHSLTAYEEHDLRCGIKQYMLLAEFKDCFKDGRPCSFLTLLWSFRDRLVSDPRDKVYALLGLLPQDQADGKGDVSFPVSQNRGLAIRELIIDYKATIEDVYASLVKAVVLGTQSLNVLCACQRSRQFVRSWVPDWTEPWSRVSLVTNSLDIPVESLRKNSFRASAGRVASIEFSPGLRSIGVIGIRNSKVSVLGTRPPGQLNAGWAVDWFSSLDSQLLLRVETIYEEDYSNGLDPFALSICAVNAEEDNGFSVAEALAQEYYLPYAGASAETKEMVRINHERKADKIEDEYWHIEVRVSQMLDGRSLFIAENGYCGLVPDHTEIGDLICVLFGCDVPVVLRPKKDHYEFIGECYVRGLMYGEAIEALKHGNLTEEHFEIF